MDFKSTRLIFFSPTHTSQQVVNAIAEGINLPISDEIDLTYGITENIVLTEDTLAIIGIPTYAGRISPTASERLKHVHGNTTPAIIVVLYGNRDYEDALLELHDQVKAQGFIPVAGGAFVGEHSYSTTAMPTAAGRPDESDILIARNFGKEIFLKQMNDDHSNEYPRLEVKGSFPYKDNKPKTPATPTTVSELCIQCQCCIEICPVEAIELKDEIVSDPEVCIKCCACVKECPNKARVFNTPFTEFLFKNFHDRKEPELFL